ncbi:MAG TPA: PIN domain-containing protein [Solirubrobacteraceae bacterium]|jgi:predicted nucleic acid-binding protein|nr:PIN domain-containing protein [Solirubrobacteraceae bacterium]
MSTDPPYGGIALIADTSARMRTREQSVREQWAAAVQADQIATCSVVTMELLYSARNADGIAETEKIEATLRQIPVTASVQRAAIGAVRELGQHGAGAHRIPPPDILIAAAAQEAGVGVLHYDRHYDRLAEVLSFESVWVAPPGSL